MPTTSNVKSPVTLIAHGRSGTSLIHKAFEKHPDVDSIGETADLVLGSWHSMQCAKGIVRGGFDSDGKLIPFEQRCLSGMWGLLIDFFPSNKRFWMHKPIGASFIRNLPKFRDNEESFISWYWDSFASLFPEGRFVTVLRNPCDVVLSSSEYWGMSQRDAWRSVAMMARILMHPKNLITHAIRFEGLVNDPEEEFKRMCLAAQIPFDSSMLEATQVVHVPRVGKFEEKREAEATRVERGFSRKTEWANLKIGDIDSQSLASIRDLWERYSEPLVLPNEAS